LIYNDFFIALFGFCSFFVWARINLRFWPQNATFSQQQWDAAVPVTRLNSQQLRPRAAKATEQARPVKYPIELDEKKGIKICSLAWRTFAQPHFLPLP